MNRRLINLGAKMVLMAVPQKINLALNEESCFSINYPVKTPDASQNTYPSFEHKKKLK